VGDNLEIRDMADDAGIEGGVDNGPWAPEGGVAEAEAAGDGVRVRVHREGVEPLGVPPRVWGERWGDEDLEPSTGMDCLSRGRVKSFVKGVAWRWRA